MSRFLRKLDGETEENHQLFIQFYYMGDERSINELSQQTLKSKRHLYRLAKKYNWRERIDQNLETHNLKLKAEFARKQKADLEHKINLMNKTYDKVMEIAEMANKKAGQLLNFNLDPEIYLKRANQYISLMNKVQRFEKNFQEQIENYELTENVELEDLEDELEKYGDNEMSLKALDASNEKIAVAKQLTENIEDKEINKEDNQKKSTENSAIKCHDEQKIVFSLEPGNSDLDEANDDEIAILKRRLGLTAEASN